MNTPANYSTPRETCSEFMWMYSQEGEHAYKHRDTRLYCIVHAAKPEMSAEMLRAARQPWRNR